MSDADFIGNMVHWIVPCGKRKGEILPALIVRVRSENRCDLHVFTGDPNETFWKHYMPSKQDQDGKELGSWHWRE